MEFTDLDLNKVYTYADFLKWDFKECVKLIRGKILKMSPAPTCRRQALSMNISGQIWERLKGSACRVYTALFDVRIPLKLKDDRDIITVMQPDISVICDKSNIDGRDA